MAVQTVHLSNVVRRPLVDSAGDRIGKVEDLVVRLGDLPHPPIVGAVVKIGSRESFLPIDKITDLGVKEVRFEGSRVDIRRFERRAGELLLARDLLSRHFINTVVGRLIRANEIELATHDGRWEVVGVDPSARTPIGRIMPKWLRSSRRTGTIVDWSAIEPFVAHVPTARLRIPYRKLARLHPAQIADLVEAASHQEGEEIIEAVGADHELEADVFEELDPEHQVEFLRNRSDVDAARVLGGMAPDDAADLIMDIDQERRIPILNLLAQPQQGKVRSLLSYNPQTAGGLMSPDFVAVPQDVTVGDALDAIRRSTAPDEALSVVFVTGNEGQVIGSVSLISLLRSASEAGLGTKTKPSPPHVHADWDLTSILRKMSDYNLAVAPVFDKEHNRVLGVVTVDDLLELLLPSGWRRDYGPAAAEG